MKFILISLSALFWHQAWSLDLSLDQAKDLARTKSWDTMIALEQHETILLQRRQVIASVLPQVSAQTSYQNYITPPNFGGFSLNSTHQVDMGVSIRQKLFEFGGIGNSLKAAGALLKQSEYRKEQVQRYIDHETTLAYFSVLLAQEQLKIAEESFQTAKNNLRILRQSFSAGRAPRGDILRLETDIVSRQSTKNIASSDLESAHLALKELLKIAPTEKLKLTSTLEDAFPALETESLTADLQDKNLDLKILQQNIEYLKNVSVVERASLLPKFGLFYNYLKSGRSDQTAFGMDQDVTTQVVGVELTWSLWNGGANKARFDEAKKNTMIADYQYKKSSDKLELDLRKAMNEYEAIRQNLETDRQSLKLAKESFELVQGLLKVGKTSITELNSTEGVLNNIKASYALNLFRAQERLSTIQYLTQTRGI